MSGDVQLEFDEEISVRELRQQVESVPLGLRARCRISPANLRQDESAERGFINVVNLNKLTMFAEPRHRGRKDFPE